MLHLLLDSTCIIFFADKKITFTFAYEFIPHLREGNRKTQAIEAMRFLLL